MIGSPERCCKFLKFYVDLPAGVIPCVANFTKFIRLGATVTVCLGDAKTLNYCMCVRINQVAWHDFAHGFIEMVSITVAFFLGAPNVAPAKFLTKSLFMIYPPVAHASLGLCQGTDRTVNYANDAPGGPGVERPRTKQWQLTGFAYQISNVRL